MVRCTVFAVVAVQLSWFSLVTAASIHLNDLFSRTDSCESGYSSCGGSYPSDFCCPSSSKCLGLDHGSSVLCCPAGVDCTYIQPITCDIQAQNATADASANVKTTRLSDELSTCGSACCPFGYSCVKNSTCVLDKSTSSEASKTTTTSSSTASATTASAAQSTTASPTATATVSLSVPTSATAAAVSSVLASTTTADAQVAATCQEFPVKAIVAGFFPGLISGSLAAAIFFLCRRKKTKSEEFTTTKKEAKHISPRPPPPIAISDPIPAEDNSFRTDFLLQRFSGRYPSNPRSKSVLHRTGTRVKSLFSSSESPQWNSAPPPPLPSMPTQNPAPSTPPQQTSQPSARQPSTESIKVYSPPNMLNSSPTLRPGAARTVQQERPQTTFSQVMEKVGFQNSNGDPYYRVTETPVPRGGSPMSRI